MKTVTKLSRFPDFVFYGTETIFNNVLLSCKSCKPSFFSGTFLSFLALLDTFTVHEAPKKELF